MNANAKPAGDLAVTFRFGEFTFDCGSRLLTCNGVKRHLSPKAQTLLQMLILARPRALSREELYDVLWPQTFVSETNLAGVINELRRALGDDPRTPNYVRTVHSFGYSFCGEVTSSTSTVNAVVATLRCDGHNHPLYDGDNVIGRAIDCRVVIPAGTISRRHALISISAVGVTIRDLDSKNGTYVEGKKVGRLPVLLHHRARLAFGPITASIAFRKISTTASLELDSGQLRRLTD